eukprot:scaffold19252_cov76-Skeletonema_marinoi.AAC.3
MVSRKRNKGKARRALKAEKERAKAAEAEVLESLAVQLECESPQNTVVDAKKNLFGSEDISPDEVDDAGAQLVILTRKRRGLVTSFS